MKKKRKMSRITNRIYIGNFADAQDTEMLMEKGITGILNVCQQKNNRVDEIEYVHIPLHDGQGNSLMEIVSAIDTLHSLLDRHKRVLVHCAHGIHRSPAIVALYLYEYGEGEKFFDYYAVAIGFVQKQRPCTCPDIEITEFL